ncbi:MAG: hypothetical protein IJ486_02020 [Firmicutes bacterium]|nr:hypothetical protein [Bacillota bacterium]
MKRVWCVLLVFSIVFGLCGCGGGNSDAIDPELIADAEAYAEAAVKYGKYSSGEEVNRVIVKMGDDLQSYVTDNAGQMEAVELDKFGAIAIIYSNKGERVIFLNQSIGEKATAVEESTEDESEDDVSTDSKDEESNDEVDVLRAVAPDDVSFSQGGGMVIGVAAPRSEAEASMEDLEAKAWNDPVYANWVNKNLKLETYNSEDSVRWNLAQVELEYEEYCATETVSKVLTECAAQISAVRESGEDYQFNEDWLLLQAENKTILALADREMNLDRFRNELALYENGTADDKSLSEFYKDELYRRELRDVMLMKYKAVVQKKAYQEAGETAYALIKEQAEALKTQNGEQYRNTIDYYTLRESAVRADSKYDYYESIQWNIYWYDKEIQQLKDLEAAKEYYEERYLKEYYNEYKEYSEEFRILAKEYASYNWRLEQFKAENAVDIQAYNTACDTIKANYTDNGYEKDIEYLKLQIKYEEILNAIKSYESDMAEVQASIDELTSDYDEEMTEIEEDRKDGEERVKLSRDDDKLKVFFLELAEDMKVEEVGEASDAEEYDTFRKIAVEEGETDTGWLETTPEYAADLEDMTSTYTPPSSGSGGSGGFGGSGGIKCSNCNGTGGVKYYYGSSDLEAILNGHDSSWYGPCGSCGGDGRI